ncbi:MAG: substrate-binding domain-containing protein, partial [Pseudomonadota bacterium]|nr:substrate-binding domain-containing protein [Pseudomonadota bacterium]
CSLRKIVLLAALFLLAWGSVACQPQGSATELKLKKISDLAGAGVRVGIVDPDLGPAGRYARQVLTKMSPVETATAVAIEKNIVTYESHVRTLLDKVLRHEIDAGFVYRSDTLKFKDKVTVIEIPAPFAVAPEYALARMLGAKAPVEALDFINWLMVPERSELWREYGFRSLSSPSRKTYPSAAIATAGHQALPKVSLTVFAAAVFYDVLPQMAKAYREESGIAVDFEFAGSGKLYQKLVQGAVGDCGADIFLSAAPSYVAELERRGLADSARTFMGNDLVIAVHKSVVD